jgi:predicted TIM-barrel fold metal-dependent hydrolase
MDELGVEKAALLYPTSDAHLNMGGWGKLAAVYNEQLALTAAKYPDRFIVAGILPPDDKRALAHELRIFQDRNLKMISLASSYSGKYLDDEYFHEIYEFAQAARIPIHVHPQIMNPIGEERLKDPLLSPVLEYVFDVSVCIGRMMMNETFLKFPDVKFIFAHFGGVLPIVKERFDNTYLMLRKRGFVKDLQKTPGEYFRNLYFDNSGSRSSASLAAALEVSDAHHILFGSDFPANQDFACSLDVIRQSRLATDQISSILYHNSEQIFGALRI